jgi:hypothetical protein
MLRQELECHLERRGEEMKKVWQRSYRTERSGQRKSVRAVSGDVEIVRLTYLQSSKTKNINAAKKTCDRHFVFVAIFVSL